MNAAFNAAAGGGLPVRCLVCDKLLSEGSWFARIRLGDGRVAFCRPQCLEKYVDNEDFYAHKSASNAPVLAS
jgi:hypothetical protein